MAIDFSPSAFAKGTPLAAVLLLLAAPADAQLLQTETRQHTEAIICTGTPCIDAAESPVIVEQTNGVAHASNEIGSAQSLSQARAAGRASLSEIAANAALRHRSSGDGNFQDLPDTKGRAIFEMDLVALAAGDVFLHFELPPGFVEIESNAEWLDNIQLTATIQADIVFCAPACILPLDPLFQLFAVLEGGFLSHTLSKNAVSPDNPSLDLSPLLQNDVVVNDQGFVRTRTWEYAAFEGDIPLGHFGTGDTFTIAYDMRAQVLSSDPGFLTTALAGINDPFFLSGDPLPQQDFFSFTFVPALAVAEPGTLSLLGAGLLALPWVRRRQRN